MIKKKKIVGLLTLAMAVSLTAGAAAISINGAGEAADAAARSGAVTHAASLSAYESEIMPTANPAENAYKHDSVDHDHWVPVTDKEGVGGYNFFDQIVNGEKVYLSSTESDTITLSEGALITKGGALCLNGRGLILDEDFIIDGIETFYICDCTGAEHIETTGDAKIVVQNGASLFIEDCGINVPIEVDGTLIVSGSPTIGSVTLANDDSIVECGELTSDADITIEENEDRKRPYIDEESFETASPGGNVGNYFNKTSEDFDLCHKSRCAL